MYTKTKPTHHSITTGVRVQEIASTTPQHFHMLLEICYWFKTPTPQFKKTLITWKCKFTQQKSEFHILCTLKADTLLKISGNILE